MVGEIAPVDGCLIELHRSLLDFCKTTRLDKDEIVSKVAGVAVEDAKADCLAGVHFRAGRVELKPLDGTDCDGAAAFLFLRSRDTSEKQARKANEILDHDCGGIKRERTGVYFTRGGFRDQSKNWSCNNFLEAQADSKRMAPITL